MIRLKENELSVRIYKYRNVNYWIQHPRVEILSLYNKIYRKPLGIPRGFFYVIIKSKDMFKKYTSIENTYRTEFLDRIKGHHMWEKRYVIQEKVHGSNLSFWTVNGEQFHTAKRTEGLDIDEKFYNHLEL